mmetsp:Transcript_17912/g.25954  ORF Transcript_17912/g.25954 Transcript_17912/m.25954 type:complete len:91 (-) Transcript_17912:9-281(-)
MQIELGHILEDILDDLEFPLDSNRDGNMYLYKVQVLSGSGSNVLTHYFQVFLRTKNESGNSWKKLTEKQNTKHKQLMKISWILIFVVKVN